MLSELKNLIKENQNILAVSKLQPINKIINLYNQGQTHFGENYIQEALAKIESLKDLNIKWHLIGPIQSNKIRYLNSSFEYLHSVDSLRTAKLINDHCIKKNYIQKIFIQINIANEDSKSGFTKENFILNWSELVSMKNINIIGLMCMPPLKNNENQLQIYFSEMKLLAAKYNLNELSMGTSADFKIALQEGSTWIRIGTALFGERTKS